VFSIENVFYFSLSLSLSLSIENVFSIENVIAIELEAGHLETSELFLDTQQSLVCSLLFRIASSSTTPPPPPPPPPCSILFRIVRSPH